MNLGHQIAKDLIIEAESPIKTIVAIYPGRFQPMGAHHAQAFNWLRGKFKDAFIATSNKVAAPKSPFSFSEKKKIIKSHGISKVKQVKSPYKAEEILKKYKPETTAAVFGDGSADDVFTLPTSSGMDLWLHAKSTTVWYIWGWTASTTTSTISDA